jgi:hypothetical protein
MIEVQDIASCPPSLTILVGDLLTFPASGGQIHAGQGVVELLGPFIPAVLGAEGEVVAPMGMPGTLLVVARTPGHAVVTVFSGDAFRPPQAAEIRISVSG